MDRRVAWTHRGVIRITPAGAIAQSFVAHPRRPIRRSIPENLPIEGLQTLSGHLQYGFSLLGLTRQFRRAMNPTATVAYVLLFAGTGLVFVLAALVLGRLVRPKAPSSEKEAVYECGEPTIGPGFVQFDLRFYVVALVFLIFDVEAAFFFPWAAVFGSVARMSEPGTAAQAAIEVAALPGAASSPSGGRVARQSSALARWQCLGVPPASLRSPGVGPAANSAQDPHTIASHMAAGCSRLAAMALADIAVFFGVLLVGFAYVWKQGDLNWVRATGHGVSAPASAAIEPPTV